MYAAKDQEIKKRTEPCTETVQDTALKEGYGMDIMSIAG